MKTMTLVLFALVGLLAGCQSMSNVQVGAGASSLVGPNRTGHWGPAVEANLLSSPNETTGVSGEIGIGGTRCDDPTNFGTLTTEQLTAHTGLRYYVAQWGPVRPYVGAGGEVSYLHGSGGGEGADACAVGAYVRAGLDVQVGRDLRLGADYKAGLLTKYHLGGEDVNLDRGQVMLFAEWGF